MRAVADAVAVLAMAAAVGLPYADGRLEVIPPDARRKILLIDEIRTYATAIPPEEGVMGQLVVSQPANACTPIEPIPSNNSTWFLLVQRHDCLIQTKLINAQKAGYSGAIIYDHDDPPPDLSFLHPPQALVHSDYHIYAILVTKQDGALLKNCTWRQGYVIDWYPSASTSLLTFLIPGIVIILFCILMIVGLMVVQQCTRWCRERRRNARHRLARKYLRQLPVKRFKKGLEQFRNYETCSICLDEYQEGDKLRILPCQHGYHSRCIDPWLTRNRRVCPLCKRRVVLPGMVDESSEDEATRPLLGSRVESSGGTFQRREPPNRTVQIEVHVDSVPEPMASSSAPATAPAGLYSLNDEIDVLPRSRRQKRKKRSRRQREPLDDLNVAGPSTSSTVSIESPHPTQRSPQPPDAVTARLVSENQMLCVTEMGSDDDQPLLV